jgi:putative ABC transport system substrate-binding protein
MQDLRRRLLLAGATVLAAPEIAHGQRSSRVWRIGFLYNGTRESGRLGLDSAIRGLRENGLVVGRNLILEARYADGKLDRLPALVAELLALEIDLMFAPSGVAAQATRNSGAKIPIVFALAPDPVGQGFATSLAHPGGNMTGLTSTHTDLSAKRVQLVQDAYPATKRIAVLYFLAPSGAGVAEQLAETERAARLLGMTVSAEQSPNPEDFARAFAAMREQKPDALIVIENPVYFTHRARLTELAAALRVPAVYNVSGYVRAGGLISYGASYEDLIRRAGGYVAKILAGANPGNLPIERPTKFELVLNMTTSRATGVPIPQSLLARADEVIG